MKTWYEYLLMQCANIIHAINVMNSTNVICIIDVVHGSINQLAR